LNNLYFFLSKVLAPFVNPTNFLFLSLLTIYILLKKLKNRKLKILFNFILVSFLFISFLPIGNLGLKILESEFLIQRDIKKTNNIIVLAGSENLLASKQTQKTELSSSSERLITTVKLALENPDANIYFLGGNGNLIKNNFDEAEVAFNFFKDVGFNVDRVNFINDTRNTIENLNSLLKFDITNERNVLITSASHMKRAIMISKKIDLKLIPYAVDFKSISSNNIINQYQNFSIANNLRKFDIFIREFLGIIVVKLFI